MSTELIRDLLEVLARALSEEVAGWPAITDDLGFDEPLDDENFRVDSLTVVCGGDWQPSHRVTIDLAEMAVVSVENLETP